MKSCPFKSLNVYDDDDATIMKSRYTLRLEIIIPKRLVHQLTDLRPYPYRWNDGEKLLYPVGPVTGARIDLTECRNRVFSVSRCIGYKDTRYLDRNNLILTKIFEIIKL